MSNLLKIGIPLLLIFGAVSFLMTGSLGEVTFTESSFQAPKEHVAVEIKALAGSNDFMNKMDEVSKLNKSNKLLGTFAVWYSNNPDIIQDSIMIRIGVVLPENSGFSLQTLPDSSFRVFPIETNQYLQAEVNAKEMFTPGPSEVNKRLEKYASENNLKLASPILEQYLTDGRIITSREILK